MKLLDSALASTSGSSNTTWTYTGNETPNEIEFMNDSDGDITLVVGKHTIVVQAGETLNTHVSISFTEIGITTTGNYRMLVGS